MLVFSLKERADCNPAPRHRQQPGVPASAEPVHPRQTRPPTRACRALVSLALTLPAIAAEPPSRRLAFPRDGAIYILHPATGKETQVVKNLSTDRPIEWPPDGREILYCRLGQDAWDLWLVGIDGNNPRNLTNVTAGGARSGAFSPDGTSVAFMRDRPQGLYLISREGKDPRRLTHDGLGDQPPAWSPDGKWLAYPEFDFVDESARADAKFKIQLYVVGADGAGKRKLVSAEGSTDAPTWSVKNQIAYRGSRNGNGEICITDFATGNQTVLTRTPAEEHAPSWSPDGSKIAFWRDAESGPELHVLNADGTAPKKLASMKPNTRTDRPQWSPDGKWLAYGGTDPADGVWIVPTTGGQPKLLTKGCGAWARWAPAPKE